ncbi:decarboxylating cobalt-precorrin-6B (C(15))-methyltransferase [Carnobacteriaceae bacterium zg-84]|uniref:decarboxylating cobalt-precorrin-6B (C(15))-methyltransferase n=1 Tax=Granulicatella sp. zg-84 TaxID=2678503 RepID=UPI0013BED328|nr:decarboxylating cobalt-precorrin-6B (C(15))-methyltransferase [Granulicatella sp. zg-84]NEW65918.1 decarboxylating cobalt-precorrin-6B (C(15))-methyltransferase [Granulicatella sp. zg-84]QMI85146.1 decarboxylating cobalt-precorrin-6B (C(15))-methyltransferase [Carnobacteriaceae bacterium zg-84]
MRDNEFIRTKVPMTKEEIRAISIDKLQLHRAKRMLDVGSGTGSVTIQAAHIYPELDVVAIERNPDAVALTLENIEKFNCKNVTLHEGLAPISLEGQFDAIFVGGTGGNMREIFDWCHELLVPGGRLVLNFILLENAIEAAEIAEEMDWQELEVTSIQAGRWTGLGKGHYFKPQNPTIIVSCEKALENQEAQESAQA